MKCTHSVRTDVGRHREHNEDDHGVGEGVQVALHGHLFVVCDVWFVICGLRIEVYGLGFGV